MSEFTLVRNCSDIQVKQIINDKKQNVAEIIINDKYQHRFSPKSRVSKHLDMMTATDLQDRLSGGSFFFLEDQLVDFRDGHYGGFVHTDQTIAKFIELIGYQERSALPLHRRRKSKDDEDDSSFVLRKVWSDHEIKVPGYDEGGDFKSELSFVWNPFAKEVNSAFDLVRLVCTNGAVGLTSFLNTKIPLFNRWEEHLDIASTQIQNRVHGVVTGRVQAMRTERATIADCMLLEQHAFDRAYAPDRTETEREMLFRMMHAAGPLNHLEGVYQPAVFRDKNLAAQLPSHLTNMDVYNLATELRTHTGESAKSSNNALDRLSNGLMFDSGDNFGASAASISSGVKLATFSDAEKAFFGRMN